MDVYLTGMIMMNNAFTESSKQDMAFIVPLSFGVNAIDLGGNGWRRVSGTLCSLLVIAYFNHYCYG